jgi:hypothetical protein
MESFMESALESALLEKIIKKSHGHPEFALGPPPRGGAHDNSGIP